MLIESLLISAVVCFKFNQVYIKKMVKKGFTLKNKLQKDIIVSQKIILPKLANKNNRNFQLSIVATGFSAISTFYPMLVPVSFVVLIYLSIPIFKLAGEKLFKNKQVSNDLLVSAVIGLSLLSGQIFALSVGLAFYYLGHKILLKTQNHTKSLLTGLFSEKLEYVWLLKDKIELQTKLEKVYIGDQVVVHTGEMIPIDGKILQGMLLVDQHQLTGESQPIEKTQGDYVLATSQVLQGQAVIEVENTGKNTTAAKIGEILERTADHKMSLLSQGEVWSDRVAAPLFFLAAVALPVLGVVGASAILNCTFGNRLQLAAPLSVLNHLNLATQKGIMVKDGRAMETLTKVDTILFDKTGTLTTDQPHVSAIILCSPDYSEDQLLAEAAVAELKLSHPIAKAIITEAQQKNLILPEVDKAHFQIGLGVEVVIQNRTIRVGSQRFIEALGIVIPDTVRSCIQEAHEKCHSVVFVASDLKLKGLLQLEPTIRPEIKEGLLKLRQLGIPYLGIVSGDELKPTEQMAKNLSMDEFFSEVMPDEKASIIKNLQKKGRTVCFIGDGVNDTIAMQQADVSISIDGASRVACDLAQIVFMDGSLRNLPDLFTLAFSLETNMRSTLATLYTPTLINLFGAFFLGFGLMSTVIINNVSLLLALRKTKQDHVASFSCKNLTNDKIE